MKKRVAAVISSHNRGQKIELTVKSLLEQTISIEKIIIVDDGSDNGKKVPKFNNKKVEVISLKRNIGVVWGRNLGLSKVIDYDYVLIVDDDIILEHDSIARLLSGFVSLKDCVACMPVVYFYGEKSRVWSSGSGVNLLTGQTLFYTEKPLKRFMQIPAATSVLLVDMKALIKSGWYDPVYYFCYEDADFYYRLAKQNNGHLYCVRDASAYHDIPTMESLERVARRSYHIARGRVVFLSRHSKFFPLNLFFVAGFGLYYFILGIKYGYRFAGIRYARGFIDGIRIYVSGFAKESTDIVYKKHLNINELSEPAFMQTRKVRL